MSTHHNPARARPASSATSQRGSAVAEFVMVATLLIVVGLSIVQLALALHVRNTLIDAATNGARYGALANRSVEDGRQRTAMLISQSLNSGFAQDISASTSMVGDHELVEITVRTRVPLIGLLPNGWQLEVSGQAVRYG